MLYPYLLKGLAINRPNQAWIADIMYVPMEKGSVVSLDWHSRKALSWRLSSAMGADLCVQALDAAIQIHGCPES